MIESDAIVVAAGAETGRIARRLGARLPLTAGKGYSLTVHRPRIHARRPSYVAGTRVGMTPFEGMLRVLGTMELSGINRRLDRRRVDALRRTILEVVPGALEGERVEAWVGMRPVTSDGLPAIGRLPGIRNVYVATGHQMLGVTLGPSTGYALADLITEGTSDIDLSPFDPGRFA